MDTLSKVGKRIKAHHSKVVTNSKLAAARDDEDRRHRRELETERLARPATTGDIEKLIRAVNTGWVGRGFAIGLGTAVLGFFAGILLAIFWSAY